MIMPTSVLVVEQIDDGYHLSVLIVNVKSRPTEDLGLVMMTGSLLLVQNVDGVSQGQTFVIRFKNCNMKCPKCKETDHEPTAKYCHVCGCILKHAEADSMKEGKGSKPDNASDTNGTLTRKKIISEDILYGTLTIVLMAIGVLFIVFTIYVFIRQFL